MSIKGENAKCAVSCSFVVGRNFCVIHILLALYSLHGWWCNAVNTTTRRQWGMYHYYYHFYSHTFITTVVPHNSFWFEKSIISLLKSPTSPLRINTISCFHLSFYFPTHPFVQLGTVHAVDIIYIFHPSQIMNTEEALCLLLIGDKLSNLLFLTQFLFLSRTNPKRIFLSLFFFLTTYFLFTVHVKKQGTKRKDWLKKGRLNRKVGASF